MYVDFKDWLLESYEEGSLTKQMLLDAAKCSVDMKRLWETFCEESDVLDDAKAETKELLRQMDAVYEV
jgi:hypothetical protein